MAIDYARYSGLSPQQIYQQPEFANGLPQGWDWNAWQATVNPTSTWGTGAGPIDSLDNAGRLINWGPWGGNPWVGPRGSNTPPAEPYVSTSPAPVAAPTPVAAPAAPVSPVSPTAETRPEQTPAAPGASTPYVNTDNAAVTTSSAPASSGSNLTIAADYNRPVQNSNPILPQPIFGNPIKTSGGGRTGVVDAMMGRRNRWNSYS